MLSFPKGWENIPASLDPLVLVTLSSLIVGPVPSPACLSLYEGVNASSVPVDRIGEGGDGGLEDVLFPFAAPFFRARLLLTSKYPAWSEALESDDGDSPMVM